MDRIPLKKHLNSNIVFDNKIQKIVIPNKKKSIYEQEKFIDENDLVILKQFLI
jgi:hypothetical protein